jgi:lipopolysaccharide transport system ATP-binding protein
MVNETRPTIFHITHWKAGSQWVRKILEACVPDLIVTPQVYETQFLKDPLQAGRVYPTVYVTREQFHSVTLPQPWKRFVVIRDLRDTLVSVYFSVKFSHQAIAEEIVKWRAVLDSVNEEDGLLYMLDEWLPRCAVIQISWLDGKETIWKYEDLLQNDHAIFEQILLDQCQLPVSRERFREVVEANQFEKLSAGRQRGTEDVKSHERKGISGDWKNHFTDKVKKEFKEKYGQLLIATGYESSLGW